MKSFHFLYKISYESDKLKPCRAHSLRLQRLSFILLYPLTVSDFLGYEKVKSFLKITMLSSFAVLILSAITYGETYKWVDEKGVIHFQDYKPDGVSPGEVETLSDEDLEFNNYVDSSKESEVRSYYPNSESGESDDDKKKKVRYSQNQKVELYVTSWCGWCKKAEAFFNARGISFVEYNVEKDKNAARRLKELNRRGGVPVAVINGKKILGFSEGAYENALKKR